MKTIKELEAEDTCHEDSYFKAGQLQAYGDVLGLIDEIESHMSEHKAEQVIYKEELKARITG